MKSNIASAGRIHRPTPPACGQTGTPNRATEGHRQRFVDAAETGGVDLAEVDRAGLPGLLEEHAIRGVLAGGDAEGAHGPRERRVSQHVVRARRLFDPPRVEHRERLHARDGFADVPLLVRVDHQLAIGTDRVAHDAQPPRVVFRRAADLDLEVREPVGDRFVAPLADQLVGIAHPAHRCRVRGIAGLDELGLAIGLRRRMTLQTASASSGVSASVM